jgi:hypothetical protein
MRTGRSAQWVGRLGRALLVLAGLLGTSSSAYAQIATGTYTGDGVGGRAINVGFQPDIVIIKADNGDISTPTEGVIRTSTMTGTKGAWSSAALQAGYITSLTATGFTVGSDIRVNALNVCGAGSDPCVYYWAAFKADADIKVGTYLGDGAATQSIGSVGFAPEYVIVMGDGSHWAYNRTNQGTTESRRLRNGGTPNNGIPSLDANGFTVGNTGSTTEYQNESGVTYHYVAFNDSPGKIDVGGYPGTGSSQNITGVGFQPGFVITQAWTTANQATFKSDRMAANESMDFAATVFTNRITALLADGFTVSGDTRVGGSGESYGYIAFNACSDCCPLAVSEGAGTVTVTALGSFEMTFDKGFGGGIELFYDLAEDPSRTYDLAGKPTADFHGLFHSSMKNGGLLYTTGTNDLMAKADLLEATPTRVRLRQESFFQRVPPATTILAGVKAIGDYSVYSTGKTAVHWNRKTTTTVPQDDHPLEIGYRRETGPDPRDNWTGYSQSGTTFPAPAGDDFVLAQIDVPGVRTDFLAIIYDDWPLAEQLDLQPGTAFFSWRDTTSFTLASGLDEIWDFLIYFKPTDFLNDTDPPVTSRSADYRLPDTLTINAGKGSPWLDLDERTSAGDFFNESEAAYALEISPSLGLDFDISGTVANPRYKPFFEVRQWRSVTDPPSVTLEGNPT